MRHVCPPLGCGMMPVVLEAISVSSHIQQLRINSDVPDILPCYLAFYLPEKVLTESIERTLHNALPQCQLLSVLVDLVWWFRQRLALWGKASHRQVPFTYNHQQKLLRHSLLLQLTCPVSTLKGQHQQIKTPHFRPWTMHWSTSWDKSRPACHLPRLRWKVILTVTDIEHHAPLVTRGRPCHPGGHILRACTDRHHLASGRCMPLCTYPDDSGFDVHPT